MVSEVSTSLRVSFALARGPPRCRSVSLIDLPFRLVISETEGEEISPDWVRTHNSTLIAANETHLEAENLASL